MNKLIRRDKGFTIIEVVLVLAIAALIFLMVFVALPALQKNQRDTARKNDASVVASSVQNFMSAERRAIKASDTNVLRGYVEKLDQYEPSTDINVLARNEAEPTIAVDAINVYPASKCAGTKVVKGVTRSAAVMIFLESNTRYCIDV